MFLLTKEKHIIRLVFIKQQRTSTATVPTWKNTVSGERRESRDDSTIFNQNLIEMPVVWERSSVKVLE